MKKSNKLLTYRKKSAHNFSANNERPTAKAYQEKECVQSLPAGDWKERAKNHFPTEEGDYRDYYRVR